MKETQLILTDDLLFRNFRYFRQKFGLTRKNMAFLLNIPPYYIRLMDENRWVDATIELSKVIRMAQIFGVQPDAFLSVDFSTRQKQDNWD